MQLKRFTAVLATAAVATGGGLSIAQAAPDSQGDSATQNRKGPGPKHRRGPSAAQLAALADKLGVTTAELKAAMKAVRPAKGSERPRRGSLAADLADALGVERAPVKEILDANRPRRARPRARTVPAGRRSPSARS